MPTGSNFMPSVHFCSHWVSWGHTLPQTAGSEELSEIILYASSYSPVPIFAINSGMDMFTGQPFTHGLFLQLRQRCASATAVFFVVTECDLVEILRAYLGIL